MRLMTEALTGMLWPAPVCLYLSLSRVAPKEVEPAGNASLRSNRPDDRVGVIGHEAGSLAQQGSLAAFPFRHVVSPRGGGCRVAKEQV